MEENRQNGPTVQKKSSPHAGAGNGMSTAQWRNTAIVAGILAVVFVGSYLWFQSGVRQEVPILPAPSEDAAPGDNTAAETAPEAGQAATDIPGAVDATEEPLQTQGEQEAAEETAAASSGETSTGNQAAEAAADGPAFQWPVTGWIAQQFGWQYSETFRDWRWHSGVDIMTEPGAEVRSAADGTVRAIREDANWGTMIEVEYEDGWLFRYGNVTEPRVEVGQAVAQGDVLAVIGPTGTVEEAMSDQLHLETVQEDIERDPLTVIRTQ